MRSSVAGTYPERWRRVVPPPRDLLTGDTGGQVAGMPGVLSITLLPPRGPNTFSLHHIMKSVLGGPTTQLVEDALFGA